jgi:hypothetical protein
MNEEVESGNKVEKQHLFIDGNYLGKEETNDKGKG